QRAQDHHDAGADRRHRGRILWQPDPGHGFSDLDRRGTAGSAACLGRDIGGGNRRFPVLWHRGADRKEGDVLAPVAAQSTGLTPPSRRVEMKKLMLAAASCALAGNAHAEELTLQLKWVTQAQFAGYYVALDKGFYEEEGLEVTIKPGGPDIAPTQVLAGGGADVIVEWMPAALAAREKGLPLVNIAQPFKKSGMMLTCLKESGITDPTKDFAGKTLGGWFSGK